MSFTSSDGDDADDSTASTDRRRLFGAAGAASAIPVLGALASGSAAAGGHDGGVNTGTVSGDDYDTEYHSGYTEVTVEEDGYWECELGSYDVLSNYLIDVSADGANAIVIPEGRGWTVQHVGVRGEFDGDDDPVKHVTPAVPKGGVSVAHTLYMGDGSTGGENHGGIYVPPGHAGTIRFERLNLQGWADNGLYGSAPGNPDDPTFDAPAGAGGVVEVHDSYGRDNGVASFRIGTDGSFCDNCVSVGGDRGFWGYYEDTDYVNCDATATEAFRAGARTSKKAKKATVTLTNSRADGNLDSGPGTVEGEPDSRPRTWAPQGVPSSAKAAARGRPDLSTWIEPRRFAITAEDKGSPVDYRFVVPGDVSVRAGADGVEVEGDGGVRFVSGTVQPGGRHEFCYAGAIVGFEADADLDKFSIAVNGCPVKPGMLPAFGDD